LKNTKGHVFPLSLSVSLRVIILSLGSALGWDKAVQ